jgi:signal transduction histidine kinase
MDKGREMENVLAENKIFKIKLLRNILIVSLSIATALAFYNVFFIYPSFTGLLIESTKKDSVRAIQHLGSMFFPEQSEVTKNSFNVDLMKEIGDHKNDFGLMKIKVYSKSGKTLFSTDVKDVGVINKLKYFHEIVALGNFHTEVVPKGAISLEGWRVTADVVETYMPLMNGDNFLGAFETYIDITDRKKQLDNLTSKSTAVLITLTVGLLLAIMIMFFKENKTTGERKLAEKALQESGKKLHFLSSHLLTAQERERRRISLELHDELGQSLTVLKLQLRSIEKALNKEQSALKEDCEKTLQYVDQIIENVRRLSRDLSPSILEDLGLTAALQWLIEDFAKHSTIKVDIDMPVLDNLFSDDAQIIIYRIFQEAFTNIGKHALADTVSVVVKKMESSVHFQIQDDGKGFDIKQIEARYPTKRSLGLLAMDERARMLEGQLVVHGQKGTGTRIIFTVPIDSEEKRR